MNEEKGQTYVARHGLDGGFFRILCTCFGFAVQVGVSLFF